MQERRCRPATADDFHRLADLAKARGLRLFREGPRWYCSSASDAGGCHYVTGYSCDCRGFISHGRCTHHALLLDRLGWIPDVEPELPYVEASAIDCVECCGCGVQDFGRYALPCETCGVRACGQATSCTTRRLCSRQHSTQSIGPTASPTPLTIAAHGWGCRRYPLWPQRSSSIRGGRLTAPPRIPNRRPRR